MGGKSILTMALNKLQCDKSFLDYGLYSKIENRVLHVLGRKYDEPGR